MAMLHEKNEFDVLQCRLRNIDICIELRYIEKILPLTALEPVPHSQSYVVGLMNLAGESIIVIDLAMRIGIERYAPYSVDIPILLCSDQSIKAGLIVDEVKDIYTVKQDLLQLPDRFNHSSAFFKGVIQINDQLTLLLNMKNTLRITLDESQQSINELTEYQHDRKNA